MVEQWFPKNTPPLPLKKILVPVSFVRFLNPYHSSLWTRACPLNLSLSCP